MFISKTWTLTTRSIRIKEEQYAQVKYEIIIIIIYDIHIIIL